MNEEEVKKFKKTVQDANKRDVRNRLIGWSLYFISALALAVLIIRKGAWD